MKLSKSTFQQLSIGAINQSKEIQTWLSQFGAGDQQVAKLLLSRIRFVSRDEFSSWLRRAIGQLPAGTIHALYSVRKLGKEQSCFWDQSGEPVVRPGTSLGSEDLVYSLISNLVRSRNGELLDHPALSVLKEQRVRSYVLVDDSIGSGDRVSGFINAMLKHPTFLSWWSFGWVKIHIVSFARPRQTEAKIVDNVLGSDHGKRRFRKSRKIDFTSEVVYDVKWYEARWGEQYDQVVDLCRRQTKIPLKRRLGYGDVMANIVFYHSVPNNLPGVLWSKNKKWQGLMPGRAIPDWLQTLLDQQSPGKMSGDTFISDEMLKLLALVKRGVRNSRSIAIRLGVDHHYATELINHAIKLGLLTTQVRLTPVGQDRLYKSSRMASVPEWDWSLYIPSSWCAGRATVQPLTDESSGFQRLVDSVEASAFTDGGVGQAPLEGSDAKAAAPPFSVTSQSPSSSRKGRDTDGPKGPKER